MEIYRNVLDLLDRGESVALLLVVATSGSVPQRIGAKALVNQQGKLLKGTIGGGLMESKALAIGKQALQQGRTTLFEVALNETYVSRHVGPICGGTMQIFAMPCQPEGRDAYACAVESVQRRQRSLLLTTLIGRDAGCLRWFSAEAINDGTWPIDFSQLQSFLQNQTSGTMVESQLDGKLFVEPMVALPRMLIVGGGHVGQAVATQAIWLGFDVTVLDDRIEFVQPDRFPAGAKVICGEIGDEVARFPKEKDSYIILVSKGHKPDAQALERCIHANSAYIGMIGSRRKTSLLKKDFLASGLATEAEFSRVFSPIGLDLGAVTVEEIATSIMAQVIAVRRRGRTSHTTIDIKLP